MAGIYHNSLLRLRSSLVIAEQNHDRGHYPTNLFKVDNKKVNNKNMVDKKNSESDTRSLYGAIPQNKDGRFCRHCINGSPIQ